MERKDSATIRLPQTTYDSFEECPVDMDVVLPDYCADVSVILKCMIDPCVINAYQNGDRYTVDGTVAIRVLYLSEDRMQLHCHKATQPFTVNFRVKDAVHYHVSAKADYVNCRATGPRRLDIHGAYRVLLRAIGVYDISVCAVSQKNDICCKTKSLSRWIPVYQVNKAFTVSEILKPTTGIDRLLYAEHSVKSYECKPLVNKMIVKGVLRVKSMCLCDSDVVENVDEIPFSQIVDVNGLNDGWESEVKVAVCEDDTHVQQNESGASVLCVSVKLMTSIYCHQHEQTEVVLDAYSTEHPLSCETTVVSVPTKYPVSHGEHAAMQLTTPLPDHCADVVDVWSELKTCETQMIDDTKKLHCCFSVGMIICDHEGYLQYVDRTVDGYLDLMQTDDVTTVKVIGTRPVINGDTLRVQIETEAGSENHADDETTVVTSLIRDESVSYNKGNVAIRIVYAEPGDTVWGIAKMHHSSVEEIMEENDLSNELIAVPTMLMIPIL